MKPESGPETVLRNPEIRAKIARDYSEFFHKDLEPKILDFISKKGAPDEEREPQMRDFLEDLDEFLGPLANAQRQLIGQKFDEKSSRDLPHYVKLDELKRYLEREPFSDITYSLAQGIIPFIEGVDATLELLKPIDASTE